MGSERTTERTRDVAVDPPVAAAAAPAAAAGATPPAAVPAAAPAFDPAPLVAAVDGNDGATALRLACASPAAAIAGLSAASKLDAFYVVAQATPLTAVTRRQLNTIYAGVDLANKMRVFSVRFRLTVTQSGGTNFTEAELDLLFNQAILLPAAHVEGIASFQTLQRTVAGPSSHSGSTVSMREVGAGAAGATTYSQTFRHEIGHAVDDALGATSTTFRQTTAGWTKYDTIDAMITDAGGYGTLPVALQPVVRTALDNYRGAGNTFTPPTPTFEGTLQSAVMAAHPEVIATEADGSDAVSQDMTTLRALYGTNLLLKIGVLSEGENNHWRFATFPSDGTRHFYINHWYGRGYAMSAATHADLVAWNNTSAAFSDAEWFAEVYAEWYKPGGHRTFAGFVETFMNGAVARYGSPAQAPQAGAQPSGGHPRVR